jgi:diacylglycerol kinase family enzyme
MGGDGTIKLVAQLIHNKIPIGILPAGSSNGLATDLDLPIDINRALEIAIGNNIKCIDTLNINDQMGLHISDMGMNAELIKGYKRRKCSRPFWVCFERHSYHN